MAETSEIGYMPELLWSQVYHDTIIGSDWLLDKSISPGGIRGWAVGHNLLYALYRVFAYGAFDKVVKSLAAPCNLILVDGPFGGRSERSRRDIVPYLPQLLAEDFVIMIDDCGRKGEANLVQEIRGILDHHKIEHTFGLYKSGGTCHVGVIACKKWRFFTSM